jgi:outer membrane protein assembly factor BamB
MLSRLINLFKSIPTILLMVMALSFCSTQSPTDPGNQNQEPNEEQYPEILWFYNLNAPSFGSAAVGDIDGDGHFEIVFGTYFNDEHIYALNGENGTLLWRFNTGGCNDASLAIVDVDGDGALEVVAPASSPSRVYCFNGASGEVKWSTSTGNGNSLDSPPAVADVDEDGRYEIVLGTLNGDVFCFNAEDGSICWQINLGTRGAIQSGPNILDPDADGKLDVVVAQYGGDNRVYALKGVDGSSLWYADLPQDRMYSGGSFADIDEDGQPEIVIGSCDGNVYMFNGEDGSLGWSYSTDNDIYAPTSIADLNNDGHLEIIFVSDNVVGVLSHTGSLIWSYAAGGPIFRGTVVSDMDGDNIFDVVFGSSDGILRILRGSDGNEIWSYNLSTRYGKMFAMNHAPVIADFNNDGKSEIFVVGGHASSSDPGNNHGRAYTLIFGNGTGPGWLMFKHDLRHSSHFTGY